MADDCRELFHLRIELSGLTDSRNSMLLALDCEQVPKPKILGLENWRM